MFSFVHRCCGNHHSVPYCCTYVHLFTRATFLASFLSVFVYFFIESHCMVLLTSCLPVLEGTCISNKRCLHVSQDIPVSPVVSLNGRRILMYSPFQKFLGRHCSRFQGSCLKFFGAWLPYAPHTL